MGVDFGDYDNDRRPDVIVTDLLEREVSSLSPQRRRELSRRHQHRRPRQGDARVLGLEHAVLRLRQRRLERHLRGAGTRDGHDREDVSQPAIPATAAAAAQREPGRFVRVIAGAAFEQDWAGRGAAFGDLDNDGDLDVVVGNVGQRAIVLRNDGAGAAAGCVSRPAASAPTATGSAVGSRSCRRRARSTSRRRPSGISRRATSAPPRRDRRRPDGEAGRDPLAVEGGQTFANVATGTTLVATEPAAATSGSPPDDDPPHADDAARRGLGLRDSGWPEWGARRPSRKGCPREPSSRCRAASRPACRSTPASPTWRARPA